MKYEYGVEYPTNGKKPDLPGDVLVETNVGDNRGWLSRGQAITRNWELVDKFRIVDDRYKPKSEPAHEQSWFEKGELPPVGWKGLVNNGGNTDYFDCEIVAYHYNGRPILKTKGSSLNILIEKPDCWKFRQVESERDKFIEAVRYLAKNSKENCSLSFCAAMYDAGFRAQESKQ